MQGRRGKKKNQIRQHKGLMKEGVVLRVREDGRKKNDAGKTKKDSEVK